ncbi:alpha/beta fold hydrolase [Nocardiopsis composta]
MQAGRGAVVYDLAGSGTPVVLLHGLGHRRQTWYPVMRELAGGHRLLALDLPGFGASDAPPPGARYDVASLADTVQRICSELGLERPHLAGNSLGGALALELGARGFAASVTAFSPAGFAPAATHAGLRLLAAGARAAGRVPEPVRVAAATSPPARAIARRVLRGDPASPAAARLAFDATLVSAGSPFVRLVPRIASYRFASPVPCPVTIAWGDRDRLLPRPGRRARCAASRTPAWSPCSAAATSRWPTPRTWSPPRSPAPPPRPSAWPTADPPAPWNSSRCGFPGSFPVPRPSPRHRRYRPAMPSPEHEIRTEFFRNRPELAPSSSNPYPTARCRSTPPPEPPPPTATTSSRRSTGATPWSPSPTAPGTTRSASWWRSSAAGTSASGSAGRST